MDGKNTWKKFFVWSAIIKILIKILININNYIIISNFKRIIAQNSYLVYYFKFLKFYFVCVTISNIMYNKKNN